MKNLNIFLIFAQNKDRGYSLEHEHPRSMFWSKIRKMYTPVNPSFNIKSGVQGVYITCKCYPDAMVFLGLVQIFVSQALI